jgi:putative aldouronate transport system permease protein
MSTTVSATAAARSKRPTTPIGARLRRALKNRWLYLMVVPGVLYFAVFKYLPMWGVTIAFKAYSPFTGFWGSPWVGTIHFLRFLKDPAFPLVLRNTLILATYNLLFFFPLPIAVALLLNELRGDLYKRFIQTLIYIPHFISWVVVVGMAYILFTPDGGIVNNLLVQAGRERINFLLSPEWFRPMIVSQVIWKETGWGTILFLAALTSIDPQLYEAARIDGAGRWPQTWHVTLPGIKSTIVILLILRLGTFLDSGFEQVFLMLNPMNEETGNVFDTFVYISGIQQGNFSYATAANLFKSIVGITLVLLANSLAKRAGEEGIY